MIEETYVNVRIRIKYNSQDKENLQYNMRKLVSEIDNQIENGLNRLRKSNNIILMTKNGIILSWISSYPKNI